MLSMPQNVQQNPVPEQPPKLTHTSAEGVPLPQFKKWMFQRVCFVGSLIQPPGEQVMLLHQLFTVTTGMLKRYSSMTEKQYMRYPGNSVIKQQPFREIQGPNAHRDMETLNGEKAFIYSFLM
ncbi:hypothetical protein CIHG_10253 [Coccidioides immitis H538.4]|uniref:Uncharacterized protein n=1 Tax=Coccidioides immitis H538.4 TaxID=396776 RepID=A0A0J8UWX5_COCIT|nr:hypothetical protein CIHG_10253 [Coccidioides immitis H538.4]